MMALVTAPMRQLTIALGVVARIIIFVVDANFRVQWRSITVAERYAPRWHEWIFTEVARGPLQEMLCKLSQFSELRTSRFSHWLSLRKVPG